MQPSAGHFKWHSLCFLHVLCVCIVPWTLFLLWEKLEYILQAVCR